MPRSDRASRVVAATPARVYAALIDPDALVAWLPPAGMTGRFEEDHAEGLASSLTNLVAHIE